VCVCVCGSRSVIQLQSVATYRVATPVS